MEASLERRSYFSGGGRKNINASDLTLCALHCFSYLYFFPPPPLRAVYFACYSKAKERFNGIFVPNSNIVHICSAGSAGMYLMHVLYSLQQYPHVQPLTNSRQYTRWYLCGSEMHL